MRIRSIKPEFWKSEDIASLDWPTRLLFIGLWSYVDDNGVGRDNEKLIKADLFPLEDDPRDTLATVSRGLQALFEQGLIVRYHVAGKPLLAITGWSDHQRIDKPNKQRYEPVTSENAVIRDTLATPSRDTPETLAPGTGEQGNRGTGEVEALADKSAEPTIRPEAMARFEEFWDVFGNKVKRKDAEKAWVAALKKRDVTEELLISQAAAYVLTERQKDGGRYICHPVTWLRAERWNDERPAVRAPQTRTQEHLALVQQLRADEQGGGLPQIGDGR